MDDPDLEQSVKTWMATGVFVSETEILRAALEVFGSQMNTVRDYMLQQEARGVPLEETLENAHLLTGGKAGWVNTSTFRVRLDNDSAMTWKSSAPASWIPQRSPETLCGRS